MRAFFEFLRVRVALATVWKVPSRKAAAIRGFQATEADGVWHLHRAIARIEDPKTRAILFTHSLEEESHAEEFSHTYQLYTSDRIPPATYERKDLTAGDEPIWKVLAYVHVGEEDATARFAYIAAGLGDEPLKRSLAKIVDDEAGHVDLTDHLLSSLGAKPDEVRREYRRVRVARLWEDWLRSGKRVVDAVAAVLLSVAYFALAPLATLSARRRLQDRYVVFDNNRIKRIA